MDFTPSLSPLYTDLYQLTMAQAYFKQGVHEKHASFYYFFRRLPFRGGFVVFCGLADVIGYLDQLRFSDNDLYYLKDKGFDKQFLEYLRSFSFKCHISGVREGEIVFPFEPVINVEGNLIETQLIESMLLNMVNFQSLIATKACRIKMVAGDAVLSDFGLRRAHSFASVQATRAAIAGGFSSTSNVMASIKYGIPAVGTMAHSFIESFDDELTAFRAYAEANPDNCVLLIDTYNTLYSGLPNAITVGKEMKQKGTKLKALRLDSGDLAYLSKKARKLLDEHGLSETKIIVSNQLDEYVIKSLIEQKAPIDIYGVGTSLVTGMPDAALDGVYKLSQIDGKPTIKISDNIHKTTIPGKKKLFRYFDSENMKYADAILHHDEASVDIMFHPFEKPKALNLKGLEHENLHITYFNENKIDYTPENLHSVNNWLKSRLNLLPQEYKRFDFPHIYKVGISKKLMDLRDKLLSEHTYTG